MASREAWNGRLDGVRRGGAEFELVTTLRKHQGGGSGAFLGRASDGNRYWLKPTNNSQSDKVPITEQVVARAGRLIGSPCPVVRTIGISDAHAGWTYSENRNLELEPGIAHGSRDVGKCQQEKGGSALSYRENDNNEIRHVGIFVLYDWCWGDDLQVLLELNEDYKCWSHDHGHFLPGGGAKWSQESLLENIDAPHELERDFSGIDHAAVAEISDALEAIDRDDLVAIIAEIPEEWPVENEELETLGYFLEERAPSVATRLKDRV